MPHFISWTLFIPLRYSHLFFVLYHASVLQLIALLCFFFIRMKPSGREMGMLENVWWKSPPAPHMLWCSGHTILGKHSPAPDVSCGCSCHLHSGEEMLCYLPITNIISQFAHLFPAGRFHAAVMASLLFHLLFLSGSQQAPSLQNLQPSPSVSILSVYMAKFLKS